MLLKSQWDNEEIKEDIKKKTTWYYENENTTLYNLWDTGKAVLCTDLPQETRKTSDKQVTLSSKGIIKRRINKA